MFSRYELFKSFLLRPEETLEFKRERLETNVGLSQLNFLAGAY